ncbi:SDR family oxidoreductase [Pseudomonadota bacterium]
MHIAIVGGSGGIGQAFLRNLIGQSNDTLISATYHRSRPEPVHPNIIWHEMDVSREPSVGAWADTLVEIDWLINAAGILHTGDDGPEKTIRQFEPDFFMRNIAINALPTLLLARFTQDKFRHGRPAVFATVSARVGSITDNRLGGWYSYRSSKAALNMCMKTLAIEWKRTLPNVTVAALHPGTTDTSLSKPFQKNVPENKLFTPDQSAGYMVKVLGGLTPLQSGRFWAYNGEELPW